MTLHYDPPNGSYTSSIPRGVTAFRSTCADYFNFTRTEVIRDQSRCQQTRSEHCECGAIDFFTNDCPGHARRFFDWCVAHADALGIQSVISCHRVWGFGNWSEREYCLDPETRILHSDLMWRPLGKVAVGDSLVGCDEFTFSGSGPKRHLRNATVLSVHHEFAPAVRITFTDGRTVVCSENHRWLGRSAKSRTDRWWATSVFRPGHLIRTVVPPWETNMSHDAGYLAGVYDGEGHIGLKGFCVGFAQKPGAVLEDTIRRLRILGYEPSAVGSRLSKAGVAHIELRGLDVLRFLGSIRPVRLLERSHLAWMNKTPKGGSAEIAAMERLPDQELVDIETTTGTFIAEGLISHNSGPSPHTDHIHVGLNRWARVNLTREMVLAQLGDNDMTPEQAKQLTDVDNRCRNIEGVIADWDVAPDLKQRLASIETKVNALQVGGIDYAQLATELAKRLPAVSVSAQQAWKTT